MANQYVGQRYVPIFGRKDEASIEWDNSKDYEALTIVTNNGNSYTSRQTVPAGTDISNTEYWAATGNYNAQIEQYRQQANAYVSVKAYGAKGDGTTDDTEAFNTAISSPSGSMKSLFIPAGRYVISKTIDLSSVALFGVYNASVLVKPSGEIFHIGSNVAINNLVFEGNEGTQTGGSEFAIKADATVSNVTVDSCIASVGKLVLIDTPYTSDQSSNIQITNNQVFKWDGSHGPSGTGAIQIQNAKHILIANNLIDNADIADCGIVLWGGDADNGKTSYDGVSHIDGAIIDGNRIYHTGASSIFCSLASNLTISNNHCEDGGDFLIDPEGCRNTTIIGNYVRSGRAGCASIFWNSTGKLSFIGNTFIHTNNGEVLTVIGHNDKTNPDEIYIISSNMFIGEGDTLARANIGWNSGRTLFNGNVLHNCKFSGYDNQPGNLEFTNNYLIYNGTKIPANDSLASFTSRIENDATEIIDSNTFILKQQQAEASASVVLLGMDSWAHTSLRFTNNVINSIETNKITIKYGNNNGSMNDCLISGNNFVRLNSSEFTDVFSLIDATQEKTGSIKILYKENYVQYSIISGEEVLEFKSLPDAKFFAEGSVVRVLNTSTGEHNLINGKWMHTQLIAD